MFRIEHHVYFHSGSDQVLAILTEIKNEVTSLQPEIAALKAKFTDFSALLVAGFAAMSASFATGQASLDNIRADISKLVASETLSAEDKATVLSMGGNLDLLGGQFQDMVDKAAALSTSSTSVANIVPDDAPVVDPPVVVPPVDPPADPGTATGADPAVDPNAP